MKTKTLFSSLTLICVSAALAADAKELRPGRWETTLQLDFGDKKVPAGMPFTAPIQETSCLTKEMLKTRPLVPPPDANCKVLDHKEAGNEISYSLRCDGVGMSVKATVHSPEHFTAVTTTHGRNPEETVVMKISGRRIGDKCTAEELADAQKPVGEE